MIWRILFALGSLTALGALLYLRQSDGNGGDSAIGDTFNAESGFVATQGDLIETGDNGHPLYRLHATRIEQPTPQGTIYLTSPQLDYQPDPGNPWTLTAVRGELPQDASSADLSGTVHAEGRPVGSDSLMRIDTDTLHLDMTRQVANTDARVRVNWAGRSLRGRGMRFEIQRDYVVLFADVHAFLAR